MTQNVFIFGAGYSGKAFAVERPSGIAISGTTRSPEKLEALRRAGIAPHLFDGASLSPETAEALADTTHLVVSAAPGEDGDPVLAAAAETIRTA
ncbi:NAD(P)-dependent oxidoreductase, partial [Rhizobiaceae sp. 2RAB30]